MKFSPANFSGFVPRHVLGELVHDFPNKFASVLPGTRPTVGSRKLKQALAADKDTTRAQRSLAPVFVQYRRAVTASNELGEAVSVAAAFPFAAVGAIIYGALGAPVAVYNGLRHRSTDLSPVGSIRQKWGWIALQGLTTFAGPVYLACKLGSFLLVTPVAALVGLLLNALGEKTGLNASLRRMSEKQAAQVIPSVPAPPPFPGSLAEEAAKVLAAHADP